MPRAERELEVALFLNGKPRHRTFFIGSISPLVVISIKTAVNIQHNKLSTTYHPHKNRIKCSRISYQIRIKASQPCAYLRIPNLNRSSLSPFSILILYLLTALGIVKTHNLCILRTWKFPFVRGIHTFSRSIEQRRYTVCLIIYFVAISVIITCTFSHCHAYSGFTLIRTWISSHTHTYRINSHLLKATKRST